MQTIKENKLRNVEDDCCGADEKVLPKNQELHHDDGHDDEEDHSHDNIEKKKNLAGKAIGNYCYRLLYCLCY